MILSSFIPTLFKGYLKNKYLKINEFFPARKVGCYLKKNLNGWMPTFYRSWEPEPVKNGPAPQHCGWLMSPRVCEHASASFIIFLTLILFLFGDKNSKFRPKFLALLISRILFALCLVQRLVYIFHYPGKVDTWRGRGEFIFLPKIVHFIFLQNCELLLWK